MIVQQPADWYATNKSVVENQLGRSYTYDSLCEMLRVAYPEFPWHPDGWVIKSHLWKALQRAEKRMDIQKVLICQILRLK